MDREGLEAPTSTINKEGVYQCKKHGSTGEVVSYRRNASLLTTVMLTRLQSVLWMEEADHKSSCSCEKGSEELEVDVSRT